jgi:predicted ABC-type ATPase
MPFVPQLSALTSATVDRLFGIDTAEPVAAPRFVFIVGVPGAGKSSVHRTLEGGHATINLDTLFESIEPFRAASAVAHALKSDERTRKKVSFASIFGYGTRKEDLGMFDWYNRARPELASVLPDEELSNFNVVREHYRPLHDQKAPETIITAAAAALQRAIDRHINIVYETTLGNGRTTKVDEIMIRLPPTYRVVLYHVFGPAAEVADRIHARQEYSMPYNTPYPFYRYVTRNPEKIQEQLDGNRKAVAALHNKYEKSGAIEFHEVETHIDPERLPHKRAFNPRNQRERIVAAYTRRHRRSSSRLIPSSLKLSSSNTFRLSSSSSSERRRRTRKNT